ncbi:MAG: rhodanese-like domain-containing protein [Anaerolineales bacterium]|nr:rhodanese-like domain-containing protein [Chloroflexota bacterium]MBL6981436.1 rhodanese-like domain-containing protein [Anaerolineales bacterium]
MAKQKRKIQKNQSILWIGIIGILLIVLVGVTLASQSSSQTLPNEITVDEAYQKYQEGAFVLDVRTQEEWDEYHAPNTTLITLDQLPNRVNEVPQDQEIVVICRSGNRSQVGRDILRDAGFDQVTSTAGGLKAWSAAGYPIEGTRP